MDMQSETNLTIYDKLLCENNSPLTVSDDQLYVARKWENVEFSFLPISIKPFPFPFSCYQLSDSHSRENPVGSTGIPNVNSSLLYEMPSMA